MEGTSDALTFLILFGLLALGVLALLALATQQEVLPRPSEPSTHAIERHGTDAVDIHARLNGQDYICLWVFRKPTGNFLWLMLVNDHNSLGGLITDAKGASITAFYAPRKYWQKVIERDSYSLLWYVGKGDCPPQP